MEKNSSLIILGIDPGTHTTGYGVIKVTEGEIEAIDYGCIRPPRSYSLSDRYLVIYNDIDVLVKKYTPQEVAIESQFMQKNAQSALKLGMAKGCALIAAKKNGLSIYEYTPTAAKKSVTGQGQASKSQVQYMVQHLLKLKTFPQPSDAADALAIAICHAHSAPHLKEKHAL